MKEVDPRKVEAYIQGGDGTHRNCLVHLRNVSTNGVNDFERMAQNNIACTAGFTWHVGTKDDAQMEAFLDREYVYHAYPMKSFFAIGVLEIPMVYVPGEDHVITGLHFEIPKPRRR